MRTLFGWLVLTCMFAAAGSYAWKHIRHAALAATSHPVPALQEKAPTYAEQQEANTTVTVHGPLMDYVARGGTPQEVETLQYNPPKQLAAEPAAKTIPGGSLRILQQTFPVRHAVQLRFEVPAGAVRPFLRGNYRSFWKPGTPAPEADAAVEFLLLNKDQYEAFLNGRTGDATFSAEDAQAQEVNASLPPVLGNPAEYHLIFRNNSHDRGKKMVQADLRLDF